MIDLEEILDMYLSISSQSTPGRSFYIAAMREACGKTVDACVEILQQAREGEIDSDLRSLIFRTNNLKQQIKP